MSSVLVVVIVGVVIAVIVGATMQEGKPATPERDTRRAPEPVTPPPPPAPTAPAAPPAPAPWVPAEAPPLHRSGEPVLDQRGFLSRLRAGTLLALTVVVLGSLVAGCLGGALYLGAHLLNGALK